MTACLSPNGQTSHELDDPPTELLVGTSSGIVSLKRVGAQAPWTTARESLSGKHIGALLPLPKGLIFAGCHSGGGLHRSSDGGKSWADVGSSIDGSDVFSLAAIETPDGPSVVAGVAPINLYRSDDLGDSWQELPAIMNVPGAENWTFPPPPHIPHVKSMTANPQQEGSFYACVEQGALLRTNDGGMSWTELSGMWSLADEYYHDAHRLIIAPWNRNLFLLATGIGVYRSEDQGRSWIHMSSLDQFIRYPDGLVASGRDKAMFVSGARDAPIEWLSAGSCGRVCRSTDEGLTWQLIDKDMGTGRTANFEAMSIVSYPEGYMVIVADTDGNVFATEDRGTTWQCITVTHPVSKGGHYKIAHLSRILPDPVASSATALMKGVLRVTSSRAAKKRKASYARQHYAQ
jgi:photosystem II stability/assembly factor-like uncharacterized protein